MDRLFSKESDFEQWQLCGFAGQHALLLPSIDSTHRLMKQMALAGEIKPGALIVANQQSAGRGRHERTWASPANENVYFNILVPLDGIPLGSASQITQITALTFAEVFRNIQDESGTTEKLGRVTVKWPNDILCGKSKFCGILAELIYIPGQGAGSSTARPTPAVNMGIGINVNSDPAQYEFLGRSVTTLKEIANASINREALLQILIAGLERALGQFRAFGITPWIEAWRKMDKFIGARGTIIVNNHCTDGNRDGGEGVQKKSGCILDMQPDGSLLFKTDDGNVETVYSADLEI